MKLKDLYKNPTEREMILDIKMQSRLMIAPFMGIIFIYLGLDEMISNGEFMKGTSMYYVVLGVLLLGIGIPMVLKLKDYVLKKNCLRMIEDGGITSVDEISSSLNVGYGKVLKLIRQMIDRDVFGNAYLNEAEHKIIIRGKNDINSIVSVKCPSCGAENKVSANTGGLCEYCGAKLNIK